MNEHGAIGELTRLRAERDGLLGMNHANYVAARHLTVVCVVLVVALIAVVGGVEAMLGAIDAVVDWLVSRRWGWGWLLIALFWLRVAVYARDVFWLGHRPML